MKNLTSSHIADLQKIKTRLGMWQKMDGSSIILTEANAAKVCKANEKIQEAIELLKYIV